MELLGKSVIGGYGEGPALVTDKPVNFTGAFAKPQNLLPFMRSHFSDRHHPWFGRSVKGTVLVMPTCIGSTHAGLVLLDLVRLDNGPSAIVVETADTLLVAGIVASEVWYDHSIPVVEYPTRALAQHVRDGQMIAVNGDTGTITFK